MPKKKTENLPSNKEFVPTQQQRENVILMKAAGIKDENIRRVTINPATGKAISHTTYHRVFEDELLTAKTTIQLECLNTHISIMRNELASNTERANSANKLMQLSSKGVYEPKFNIADNATPEDMIKEILTSLSEGKANT